MHVLQLTVRREERVSAPAFSQGDTFPIILLLPFLSNLNRDRIPSGIRPIGIPSQPVSLEEDGHCAGDLDRERSTSSVEDEVDGRNGLMRERSKNDEDPARVRILTEKILRGDTLHSRHRSSDLSGRSFKLFFDYLSPRLLERSIPRFQHRDHACDLIRGRAGA